MPWRNGGGITHEIAREPKAGADFSWRLSLALIERSGPFSSFSGYQRAIALVSGHGCVLHGIEQQPVSLRKSGDLKLFSGGSVVTCELIAGACCDLNLMVREPGSIIGARHVSLVAGSTESLSADCNHAVFCLDGEIECVDAASGREVVLGLHDTLVTASDTVDGWELRTRGTTGTRFLVFAWREA